MAACRTEECRPKRAVSAAARFTDKLLSKAISGTGRNCDDRWTWTVGKRNLDESASRLTGVELAAVLAQGTVNNLLKMGKTHFSDVIALCGRVPFRCLGLVTADWAEDCFIADLVFPVLKENFEFGLALFRWATAIELAVVIQLDLKGNADSAFELLQLSKQPSNTVITPHASPDL